jgi:PAS domain S-box-containing protein
MMCETFGYSEAEMIGKGTRILYADDQEYERVGRELYGELRNNRRSVIESRLKKKGGETIDVLIGASALDPGAQDPMASVATVLFDISNRTRAEAALNASLGEKEVLLHELQHRIKNNLSMIGSMIGLEKSRVDGDELGEVLGSLEDRVRSLSSLYDLLLRSGSAETVDLAEYLRSITASLAEAYAGGASKVAIEQRMDPISTDVKSAVAWGLITNELTTNALKHAFPAGAPGAISVDLSRAEEGVRLVVSDDGIGLPPEFDSSASGGLGLEIVKMMTGQLKGTLSVGRGKGAAFTVLAPLPAGE